MPTRIKSSQILDGSIVATDFHSAIAINTTAAGTFGALAVDNFTLNGTTLGLSSGNMHRILLVGCCWIFFYCCLKLKIALLVLWTV